MKRQIKIMFLLLGCLLFIAPARAQNLDALLDISRYRVTDSTSMLELNMLVSGYSVVYKPIAKGKYQARVAVTIQISDSAGVRAADKLALLSPVVTDTVSKPNFQTVKRFLLPNGVYTVNITSADANSAKPESKAEVPVSLHYGHKDKIQISDIKFLASYKKTDKKEAADSFVRNGYELIPAMTNFYPATTNELTYYAEIYRTEQLLGKDEPFLIIYGIYPERRKDPLLEFSRHSKQKAQPVNIFMGSLDITKLPSGNYRFQIEVRDKTNKVLAVDSKLLQRSNLEAADLASLEQNTPSATNITYSASLDPAKMPLYLESLQPIANTNEISFISGLVKSGKLEDQQKYLEYFWKKRSETDPVSLWNEYLQRIEHVEKTFGLKNYRGYQTDRGRVYLQYGPPNKIDNERTDVNRRDISNDVVPYQIWHYYHIGNQNNKIFVFVQNNLGNDNYRLTHSDMQGEVYFPSWRNDISQQKFSGSGSGR